MSTESIVDVIEEEDLVRIVMNRPKVRNAMNLELIANLINAYEKANAKPAVKYILLQAYGNDFSAGADINWMKNSQGLSLEENKTEAIQLATLFHTIYNSPKITIVNVQGNVIGGGNGLVAVNDLVLGAEDCNFMFSETRLGIIPATILPYVQLRMGAQQAKIKTLLAMPFGIQEAQRIGMVDFIVRKGELHQTTQQMINDLRNGAFDAQLHFKTFQRTINNTLPDNVIELTAHAIAESRVSAAGQEGLSAFLEKRKPNWIRND